MHSDSRRATSKSAVAARAKMLHAANLGWLEGFPLEVEGEGVRWMAVPASEPAAEMRIERRHFSQATYALNKLRGELASTLDRLAEEPDDWVESVIHRLELLKGAVHQGDPLPVHLFADPSLPRSLRERAARLAAAEPDLDPFLDALSWVHAGHPERLREGLDAVAGWSRGLSVLAPRLGGQRALIVLLRLAQLAMDHGETRVEALADCLFDERAHDIPLQYGVNFCQQILEGLRKRPKGPLPEAPPLGRLGGDLALWCEQLVLESRRSRQQALQLFTLATPRLLLDRWAPWWATARQLLREAQELRAQVYDQKSRYALRTQVEQHQKEVPPSLPDDDLFVELRRQTADPSARADLLERALARVPTEATAPGRPQLFIYWSSLEWEDGTPEGRITMLLAGFERYLHRAGSLPAEALLRPWDGLKKPPQQYACAAVEVELLITERPRRTVLAAYDHLASLAVQYGGLTPRPAANALGLFLLAGDADLAARLFASLHAQDQLSHQFLPAATKLALRLCRDCPERYAGVLRGLCDPGVRWELPQTDWPETVLAPLAAGELGEFVRESIVARQVSRLVATLTKAVLLESAGIQPLPQPVLGTTAAPAWIERYPPALHSTLCRLAAVLPDAEPRAARWLADDFPDPARLEREIHALEARLAQTDDARRDTLAIRLANLRARLAQPSTPGPGRLGNLRAKLDHAWGKAVLDRLDRDVEAHLPAALCRLLGIAEVPPWLSQPVPLSLLAAARSLDSPHRQLAYRLFRLRCGPPPWDLRDAPQNQRFVAARPDLDWRPWIDGVGTVAVTAANGQPLHLALEDDPLEIFRMGAHFSTCLSPGGANYFSVFANAADINKRVLYARDPDGKVVGRCLLALTAEAELLTFEAYCHHGNLGFRQICDDFAEDLARRMGTRRVSRGKVPTLVATDWYDDGPHDIGLRFAALEDGSPLRRRLATVRPGELLDELRRGLKPSRLDETTLPLILDLPELAERPALVVPLLRPLADCRSLPDETLVTACHLAVQAGATDLVRRFFLARLADSLERVYRIPADADPRAVEVLLQLDPARLLAVLRETRHKSERDWLDETLGHRLETAARALAALYRNRQAQTLWHRLATNMDVYATLEQRQRAQERITPPAAAGSPHAAPQSSPPPA